MSPSFAWVAQANNLKTGKIPSAYVGHTREQARSSCEGCGLLADRTCYAWFASRAHQGHARVCKRAAKDPGSVGVERALGKKLPTAKAARLGVLGDPSRVAREEFEREVSLVRGAGLAVLGYTHFWREPGNLELSSDLMASCDFLDEVDEALDLGFVPAVVLPWDFERRHGKIFRTASGARGVLCPAQTKEKGVTCNSCRMCDPQASVWKKGKVQGIGFLDHSSVAKREKRLLVEGSQRKFFGGGR